MSRLLRRVARLASPQARWLRWRGLPVLVLLAALGVTWAYWQRELAEEQEARHLAFEEALQDVSQQTLQRMAAQEHLLQGVQGFLAAAPAADERALRRYVDALPLGADFAGLQAIAVARRFGAAVIVQQVEPAAASNAGLLGRDLLARPEAQQALARATASGRMALSPMLPLRELGIVSARPGSAANGFLLVMPVPVPVQGDRAPTWLLAAVAAPTLMGSLFGSLPEGLGLSLYDGQRGDAAALLYRSAAAPPTVDYVAREFLVVGGHTWTLQLEAGGSHGARGGSGDALIVLWAGIVLALLLALLAALLGTARERAQVLAERMTRALRVSEQRWAFALEGTGDGVWDWEPQTGVLNSSPRWKALMGLPGPEEPDFAHLSGRIHPEDQSRAQAELQRCLDEPHVNLISEYRVAGSQGGWNWVLTRGTVVERDAQGRPLRVIGTVSDINARRQSEERVRFMALHDPLTELANRAHFDERLHFALANARRYNESLGLILLDLDRFKPVNDQFGHAVGDQLLQTVAKRIKSSVRETDTVGRIGGDEFVVLLTGPVTRDTAQVVTDKIFNQVALPMELAGLRIEITCSLGLAIYPEDGVDELGLTKAADDAMYSNKRAGQQLMGDITNP